MDDALRRRQVLRAAGVGSLAGIAGCTDMFGFEAGSSDDRRGSMAVEADAEATVGPVEGTVVSLDDEPVADATVETVRASSVHSTTNTDASGQFDAEVDGPTWIRVTHPEYLTEIQAAEPNSTARITLTPAEGTVSMSFGGDVMFGRRYYERNDDSLSPRFRIDEYDRLADHREILSHIEPVLDHADITSVNLETPLTTSDWRHPEKRYHFASHPVAAEALAEAGVTYTALGNNHVLDALTPGLEETVESLDNAGLTYSGAGFDSEEAWEPAIIEEKGLSFAFISCTSIVGNEGQGENGQGYELDWSADLDTDAEYTIEEGGESITVSGAVGVAEADEARVKAAVEAVRDEVDIVVVQIHGGFEYQREASANVVSNTDAAIEAGADLVINHHPHVTGGIEHRDGALVAWTLGNLVFDQNIWETLRSYVLTAHVTEDGVVRTSIDPILLDGYVPKGATGSVASTIERETAALSTDEFALQPHGIDGRPEVDVPTESDRRTLSGSERIYTGDDSWIASIETVEGTVRSGRERFVTGGFGDYLVDDRRYDGPLWRFSRDGQSSGPAMGADSGGVRLARRAGNEQNSLLSPVLRLPVDEDELSLLGTYRYFDTDGGQLEILVSWYDERSGGSFEQDRIELSETDGNWGRFEGRLDRPEDAEFVDCFIRLSPPVVGDSEAVFDELRLIEWSDGAGGPAYDHLAVDGEATVEFLASEPLTGDREWTELR